MGMQYSPPPREAVKNKWWENAKMRLLIVDDHILFREGLASIIQSEPDVDIVGLAGSVQEAIALSCVTKPDVILMDFELPDGSGVEATRAILANHPLCKVIFLTIFDDNEKLISAVRSGAKGYLLKNMRPAKLMTALRAVHQGESALSRTMTLCVMEELTRTKETTPCMEEAFFRLSRREQEVLRELAHGATNPEIAQQLFLSENTVKYYIHSILEKLGLPDRKAAGNFARQYKL
jgi:DNA-binding NarL/FixJ family response regulator